MKIVLLILLGVFILYVIVINSLNTPKRIKEREATRKRRDELYKKFLEQERKKNDELSFVAIDFETATAKRYSACQLGIVVVENGIIKDKKCFLIQPPNNEYSKKSTAIHGISSKHTVDKPNFLQQWPLIKQLINDSCIVCHNSDFDIDVLKSTCNYYGISDLRIKDIKCTYRMTGYSLIEACQGLSISVSGHHNALNDAEMCANIYIKLCCGKAVDTSLIKVVKGGKKEHSEELINQALQINSSFFEGKNVVITGVFGKFNRDDLKSILEHHGAIIRTGISTKTNVVVMGMDAGPSKCAKIKELVDSRVDIVVLNETELLEKLHM